MKALKIILFFVILYFASFAYQSMTSLVEYLSFDQLWLTYVLYGLLMTLALYYVAWPLLKYTERPSLKHLEAYITNNKYERKILKYINKRYEVSLDSKEKVVEFLMKQVDEFDSIIKQYAQQTTVTVMVSPNSFIDGIAILFANSKMIFDLSSKLGFRYSSKSLAKMYFGVLSMASVTGLIEEFDDAIESIIEELAEEFSELIAEETGKSVSQSIPFFSIAVNAMSPILQAAGNYAFMLYSGNRFKYDLLNIIEDEKLSEKEIKIKARKRARSLKYVYIKDMSSRIVTGTGKKIISINPFKKKKKPTE